MSHHHLAAPTDTPPTQAHLTLPARDLRGREPHWTYQKEFAQIVAQGRLHAFLYTFENKQNLGDADLVGALSPPTATPDGHALLDPARLPGDIDEICLQTRPLVECLFYLTPTAPRLRHQMAVLLPQGALLLDRHAFLYPGPDGLITRMHRDDPRRTSPELPGRAIFYLAPTASAHERLHTLGGAHSALSSLIPHLHVVAPGGEGHTIPLAITLDYQPEED